MKASSRAGTIKAGLAKESSIKETSIKESSATEASTKDSPPKVPSERDLIRSALARALWHAGPGKGMTKEETAVAYPAVRVEMTQSAERVMMFLEKQGVALISYNSND